MAAQASRKKDRRLKVAAKRRITELRAHIRELLPPDDQGPLEEAARQPTRAEAELLKLRGVAPGAGSRGSDGSEEAALG